MCNVKIIRLSFEIYGIDPYDHPGVKLQNMLNSIGCICLPNCTKIEGCGGGRLVCSLTWNDLTDNHRTLSVPAVTAAVALTDLFKPRGISAAAVLRY